MSSKIEQTLRPLATVHLMLVDDEKRVLEIIGDLLRSIGCKVSTANTASAALLLLEHQDFDLALVDAIMPGMDGFDLLDRLRALRPKLPVVIFTGRAGEEAGEEALKRGAVDFLKKPIFLRELKEVIETQLGVELRSLPEGFPEVMPSRKRAPRPQWRTALPEPEERDLIIEALNKARWNKRKAAKLLKIGYSTLHRRIEKLGIE